MWHLQYRHAESDHLQIFCLYSRPPGPEPQWQHEAWLRDVSARTVLRHPEPRRTQDRSIPGASALQSFPNYRGRPPPSPPPLRLTFISQGSAMANDRFINSKNTPVNIQYGKKSESVLSEFCKRWSTISWTNGKEYQFVKMIKMNVNQNVCVSRPLCVECRSHHHMTCMNVICNVAKKLKLLILIHVWHRHSDSPPVGCYPTDGTQSLDDALKSSGF